MPSVTRKTSSSRQARRKAMVAQMLTATETLLDEGETFTELSVERLIGAASISRSTFYVYFEDKGTLLLALVEDVGLQFVTAGERWWELPETATRDDLAHTLRGIIDVFHEHATIWGALVDASSYDAKVRASFRRVADGAVASLARHIDEGQASGSVRPGLDPRRTAEWLIWMIDRGCYQLVTGACPAELTKLCGPLTDIVWSTLYESAPARGPAPA